VLRAILLTAVRCVEVCQVLGLRVLKTLGIERNRTADSRMVLTERETDAQYCMYQQCTVLWCD